MSSTKRFFARAALRAMQLLCLLVVLIGLSYVDPLIVAIQALLSGVAAFTDVCWKILPVTGTLLPALGALVGLQAALGSMKPSTHDPSEPWMANPMWAAKHIRLNNRGQFWTVFLSLLFYLGIVVPFSIGTQKTPFYVLGGVLGLVLLLIARVFWLNRKWNTAELRMADVPGVIGGPFSGVAILQQSFPAGTAFDVCLKCQVTETVRTHGRSSTGETSSGSKTTTQIVWSSTISIDKLLPSDSPNRTLVPFSFAIPFDCLPTNLSNHGYSGITHWELVVHQKGKVGFGGSVFTVPIFITSESHRDFTLDSELIEPFEMKVDVEAVLSRVGLKREKVAASSQRFVFEKWDLGAAYAMVFSSLVCMAIIVACFWFIQNLYGAAFASIIPGLLFSAIVYSFLDMWLWRSSMEIDKAGIRCESGWKGYRRSLEFNNLEKPEFLAHLDSLKENGEWFRVDVCKRTNDLNDTQLTLVRRLDGRAEAEAVAQWLHGQYLGKHVAA